MGCIAIYSSVFSASQESYNIYNGLYVISPCRGKHFDHKHISDFPRPADGPTIEITVNNHAIINTAAKGIRGLYYKRIS